MMDENKDEKKKGDGSQGGLPFYMVKPGPDIPEPFVKSNQDGTYDVTVQTGLVNPRDKNYYLAVLFVNKKQLDGIHQVDGTKSSHTFKSVKPGNTGEIELVMTSVRNPNVSSGLQIIVTKDKLGKVAKSEEKSKSVVVEPGLPDSDGNHWVTIKLADLDGNGRTGEVEVKAMQKFELEGLEKNRTCRILVDDANGVTKKMKPLGCTEGFVFTDLLTRQSTQEILLRRKK